ncbi:MAG: hypothetical protein DHS20C10_12610 [marine bacterium B5-7]|nr:MAG: hypothetical protein DHS20C10_12610 [marine bacterium B5-7]
MMEDDQESNAGSTASEVSLPAVHQHWQTACIDALVATIMAHLDRVAYAGKINLDHTILNAYLRHKLGCVALEDQALTHEDKDELYAALAGVVSTKTTKHEDEEQEEIYTALDEDDDNFSEEEEEEELPPPPPLPSAVNEEALETLPDIADLPLPPTDFTAFTLPDTLEDLPPPPALPNTQTVIAGKNFFSEEIATQLSAAIKQRAYAITASHPVQHEETEATSADIYYEAPDDTQATDSFNWQSLEFTTAHRLELLLLQKPPLLEDELAVLTRFSECCINIDNTNMLADKIRSFGYYLKAVLLYGKQIKPSNPDKHLDEVAALLKNTYAFPQGVTEPNPDEVTIYSPPGTLLMCGVLCKRPLLKLHKKTVPATQEAVSGYLRTCNFEKVFSAVRTLTAALETQISPDYTYTFKLNYYPPDQKPAFDEARLQGRASMQDSSAWILLGKHHQAGKNYMAARQSLLNALDFGSIYAASVLADAFFSPAASAITSKALALTKRAGSFLKKGKANDTTNTEISDQGGHEATLMGILLYEFSKSYLNPAYRLPNSVFLSDLIFSNLQGKEISAAKKTSDKKMQECITRVYRKFKLGNKTMPTEQYDALASYFKSLNWVEVCSAVDTVMAMRSARKRQQTVKRASTTKKASPPSAVKTERSAPTTGQDTGAMLAVLAEKMGVTPATLMNAVAAEKATATATSAEPPPTLPSLSRHPSNRRGHDDRPATLPKPKP